VAGLDLSIGDEADDFTAVGFDFNENYILEATNGKIR